MKLSRHSNPYITVTLQKGTEKVDYRVLFDSGDSGDIFSLSLNRFSCRIVDTIAENEGWLGFGAHWIQKTQKHLLLSIPELVVNGITFSNIIVSTTHANSSRIGVKLLQYGKTTLDYKKKRFYFEPYENINTEELSENRWAISCTYQNNKMVVGVIWDKALESQINLGDEILSIDGIDTQSLDFCAFFLFELPENGETQIYELRDINTGEVKKVEIKRLQVNK